MNTLLSGQNYERSQALSYANSIQKQDETNGELTDDCSPQLHLLGQDQGQQTTSMVTLYLYKVIESQ